jgi:DNA topoisomerase-1
LTDWHHTDFAPARAKARQLLPVNGAQGVKASGVSAIATTQLKSQATVTKTACPKCGEALHWNPKGKRYELSYAQRSPEPEAFTDLPCPVCGALLERYRYTKEGKEKAMLRCSLLEHRRGKSKKVAFLPDTMAFSRRSLGG